MIEGRASQKKRCMARPLPNALPNGERMMRSVTPAARRFLLRMMSEERTITLQKCAAVQRRALTSYEERAGMDVGVKAEEGEEEREE